MHWTFNKKETRCNSYNQSVNNIEQEIVLIMRKKVKVATLCENGQGARTAKPHGHKTDVSHGHDVGQIEVGECLSASSEPQKD